MDFGSFFNGVTVGILLCLVMILVLDNRYVKAFKKGWRDGRAAYRETKAEADAAKERYKDVR